MFRVERHHRSCPHRGAGRAGIGHSRRLADEPSFNPAMTGAELLTPLPIGLGTRFRTRMGRAGRKMVVELTGFDRPHRLGSRTASPIMDTSGALTFAAEGDGTVMGWDWQVRRRAGCGGSAAVRVTG